jgi:hypothetical protein
MTGGTMVAYGAAVLMFAVGLLLAIEARLLRRGEPPITSYTRYMVRRWTVPALAVSTLILMVLAALWAHFIWDAACGLPPGPAGWPPAG